MNQIGYDTSARKLVIYRDSGSDKYFEVIDADTNEVVYASAIIEKDLSSGLLAQELNADTLLILTSVEKVSLNLGQDNEEYLNTISVDDAKKYMADNQFAPGSMLPKFEAGISFIEKGDNRRTIITDIAHAKDGYFEKTGTIIK